MQDQIPARVNINTLLRRFNRDTASSRANKLVIQGDDAQLCAWSCAIRIYWSSAEKKMTAPQAGLVERFKSNRAAEEKEQV